MIRTSLSVIATIAYALAFLLYFFGISSGIGEAETTSSILYTALIGAVALIAVIYLGKNGEELTYPFLLTGLVSFLAFFTVFLQVIFSALVTGGGAVLEALSHIISIENAWATYAFDMKIFTSLLLLFAPLASILAISAVRYDSRFCFQMKAF